MNKWTELSYTAKTGVDDNGNRLPPLTPFQKTEQEIMDNLHDLSSLIGLLKFTTQHTSLDHYDENSWIFLAGSIRLSHILFEALFASVDSHFEEFMEWEKKEMSGGRRRV